MSILIKKGSKIEKEIKKQIDDLSEKIIQKVLSEREDEIPTLSEKIKSLERKLEEIMPDENYYFLIGQTDDVLVDFHALFLKKIEGFEFVSNVEENEQFYMVNYSDFDYDSCLALMDKSGKFIIKKCTDFSVKGGLLIIEAMGYMLDDFDLEMDSNDFYFYAVDAFGNKVLPSCDSIDFNEKMQLFEVKGMDGKRYFLDSEGNFVSQ